MFPYGNKYMAFAKLRAREILSPQKWRTLQYCTFVLGSKIEVLEAYMESHLTLWVRDFLPHVEHKVWSNAENLRYYYEVHLFIADTLIHRPKVNWCLHVSNLWYFS